MQNQEKLIGCHTKILLLADVLDSIAHQKGSELIVTSGKREGNGKSWHDKGLAIDCAFRDIHIFKLVTEFYWLCTKQEGAFDGITEFEVCCDLSKQHFHFAFGNEDKLEIFTGTYS